VGTRQLAKVKHLRRYYNYHNPNSIAWHSPPLTAILRRRPTACWLWWRQLAELRHHHNRQDHRDGRRWRSPTPLPTGVTAVTAAQFASKFGLLNAIARFDIKTAYPRLPLVILGDYVQNTRACATLAVCRHGTRPGNSHHHVTSSATCFSRERAATGSKAASAAFGGQRHSVCLHRMFIEREAVMGAFTSATCGRTATLASTASKCSTKHTRMSNWALPVSSGAR